MKMPATPPVLDAKNTEQLLRIVQIIAQVAALRTEYFHWDQLRNRRAPIAGITHEDWWHALKFSRLAKTAIPLLATDGTRYGFVNVEQIQEAVHKTDAASGTNVTMPDQLASPESKDRYLVRSLVEEAIHSSQLEGATTTRLVAKRMLREGRAPRDKSEQMILNNYTTMTQLADWRTKDLTPELVLDIHRSVTTGTLNGVDIAGRFRSPHENVEVGNDLGDVFHVPPPADELPARMKAMCDFANGKTTVSFIHPLIRAIALHYWLAYDHPFVDGNGRTARALFYWSMLRSGYWLFEFISISTGLVRAPAQYGMAFLYTQTDGHDLTYFLLHQLRVIKNALDELHEYIKVTAERVADAERILGGYGLNHRQQALAAHALRHPGHQYTIEGHQSSHKVVYQTARTDLMQMEAQGLLQSSKKGKKRVYEGTEMLQARKTKRNIQARSI